VLPCSDRIEILSICPFLTRSDIYSWGRVARRPQRIARPRFRDELASLIGEPCIPDKLPIGLRRSYGYSCLNTAGAVIEMCGLTRFISFDRATGVLRAEAGVSLSDILRLVVPEGWFLPTTPGTRLITLGGAVANDVHGKNHHGAGTIGRHVRSMVLLRSDRGRLTLAPQNDPALFSSTIAGLGLTGVVEWVELQLVKIGGAYLEVETVPYDHLDAFWALAEESTDRYEHAVAWIDCTLRGQNRGRGIFQRSNWITDGVYDIHDDRSWKHVPLEAPSFALNRFTVNTFNSAYYRLSRAMAGESCQHYAPFFYPLDGVRDWNKLYGRSGMLQYQCVIPRDQQRLAVDALLKAITASGQASFLAVLKTFGDLISPSLLSFPRAGATLALDFSFRKVPTLALLSRLDAIVAEAGGALYPAKDGRMTEDMFRRSFPRWEELAKDPAINSDFWRRVAQ
jgi:FAD/FMN-containing dehydrogenase